MKQTRGLEPRSSSLNWALHVRGQNHLLSALPAAERQRLTALMQRVETKHGDVLFESDAPITSVEFPLYGVVSMVVETDDGEIAEVGTVGNEGMVGVPLVLGVDRARNKAFYQVPGEALRMSSKDFVAELQRSAVFLRVAQLHACAFSNQVSQSAACNTLHPVEQRLARWILMCHDRVGSNHIHLTQEFLSQMLGVRRASVTIVAGTLQQAGLIRYARGDIEVLDRKGLEESSCGCYASARKEYERLLC